MKKYIRSRRVASLYGALALVSIVAVASIFSLVSKPAQTVASVSGGHSTEWSEQLGAGEVFAACGSTAVCPSPAIHNNCQAGILGATAEYSNNWQWWCNSPDGGTNVLCQEDKPTPIPTPTPTPIPTPTPTPTSDTPTVTASVVPPVITSDGSSTFSVTGITNAVSCSATATGASTWSAGISINGASWAWTTPPGITNFTATCLNSAGVSAQSPATLTVCAVGQIVSASGTCVTPPAPCPLPSTGWVGTLASGDSVLAYQAPNVIAPATCLSETRTCMADGTLSGSASFRYANCDVTPLIPSGSCVLPAIWDTVSQSCVTPSGNGTITGICMDTGGYCTAGNLSPNDISGNSVIGWTWYCDGTPNDAAHRSSACFSKTNPSNPTVSWNPSSITAGGSSTITVTPSDPAASCTGTLKGVSPVGATALPKPYPWSNAFTFPTAGTETADISCTNPGGITGNASAVLTINPSTCTGTACTASCTGTIPQGSEAWNSTVPAVDTMYEPSAKDGVCKYHTSLGNACTADSPYSETRPSAIASYCSGTGVTCSAGQQYVSSISCHSGTNASGQSDWSSYGNSCTAPNCTGCGCVSITGGACTGAAPTPATGKTISTAGPSVDTAWSYASSGAACTWKCDTGYIRSGTTCVPDTATAPDLTAGSVSPTSSAVGVSTTYSATVSNIGNAPTGAGFTNLFQKATDASGAGAIEIGTSVASAISAGGTAQVSLPYTFPATGTYYLRVCADKSSAGSAGVITESNENNNCGAWTAVSVSSSCSANQGNVCISAANNCNEAKSGILACDGLACSATKPADKASCVGVGGCVAPAKLVDGLCVTPPGNGGCTAPATLVNGLCVTPPGNGGCTAPLVLVNGACVSPPGNGGGDCTTPWGTSLANGVSITAFKSPSVVSPATCTETNFSETLTCTNGKLISSLGGEAYTNKNCSVLVPAIDSFSANPVRVNPLPPTNKTTVSWSTTDVTSCSVTRNGFIPAWKTTASGSFSFPDTVTTRTTYTITCDALPPQSAIVNVTPLYKEF